MQRVIVNPAAGGGRATQRWRRAVDALEAHGVEVDPVLTSGPRDATRLAREWIEAGNDELIAVGGDGTVNEVVDGCLQAGSSRAAAVTLGVIPLGSGSDLARALGLGRSDLNRAAAAIASGASTAIDVMRLTWDGSPEVRHAVVVVNVGLGGEVVRRNSSAVKRRLGGTASFAAATVASLAAHRPWPLTIELDGALLPDVQQVTELIVANGPTMGGGMMTHPDARLDDGELDVVIIGAAGRARLLGKLPKIYTGAHIRDPLIQSHRARRIRVTAGAREVPLAIDGELSLPPPVTIELLPAAISFISASQNGASHDGT